MRASAFYAEALLFPQANELAGDFLCSAAYILPPENPFQNPFL